MQIFKVLSRKDGSSLVVGVVLALMLQSLLYTFAFQWSSQIVTTEQTEGFGFGTGSGDWKVDYLIPALTFVIGVVLLEFLLIVIAYAAKQQPKKKGKK